MKISELPTPRLRARAIELASKYWQRPIEDHDVDKAFLWSDTTEKRAFWRFCEVGNWNKAKELQPDLFKPMDGKPHIYLQREGGLDSIALCVSGDYKYKDRSNPIIAYIMEVNPTWYPTIQEAVDALYSYRRAV